MADEKKRSTGFQERLKEGTVRKEYDKKLKDRASAKKKRETKKNITDLPGYEYMMQKKQIHNTAMRKATKQDDWSMKPGSPLGDYMEHYSAKNKLDDIRKKEREAKRMANPSYKPMMSTRPDKERGLKSGGYVKKYADGGGVRKVRR